jgi:mannose-6-phosphate isomerase-like protein (cupin superfamily)
LVSQSLSAEAGVYLGVSRLLPGATTTEACHSTDEAVFVLSGRGELYIDGERVGEFGKDDGLLIRTGCRHLYRNIGRDTIEMVYFFPCGERPDIRP